MAKQKIGGLGRGLGSILPDVEDLTTGNKTVTTSVTTIPLKDVEANPYQPRKEFDEQALNDLAESIKHQGVITPITVRKMPNGKYQIIAGERRCRASQLAGLTEIPAYIRVATDSQIMEMALVENIQRENLNAMEIAFSYSALIEECKLSQEELSKRVGKDRSTISNYLRLLNLPSETQIALNEEKISMAHARCLVNLEDIEAQNSALHTIIDKGLSVRQTEQLVKEMVQPKPSITKRRKDDLPERHAAARSSLKQHLQSEIEIVRSRKGKGTVTIHFNNDNDFDRIIKLIDKQ
ncbi:MAG: ParB/RepB/Spo0J family partition protein [Bacteroidales bacterium]|nr:ParB/RepB/Spo0J family partition protein [Bacteroidales bacterium]